MTETEQEAFADLVAELETQTAEAVKAFSKVFDRMEETNDDKEVKWKPQDLFKNFFIYRGLVFWSWKTMKWQRTLESWLSLCRKWWKESQLQ